MDYQGGYSAFSLARFGQQFLEKVANPKNILQWHCRRQKPGERDSVTSLVVVVELWLVVAMEGREEFHLLPVHQDFCFVADSVKTSIYGS